MEKLDENPFIINGEVPEEYFCDRTAESARLIAYLTNRNNVLLTSGRRMGKSVLIRHCFRQKAVADNFYTYYIDILPTSSLEDFTFALGKAVFGAASSRGKNALMTLVRALKSLSGKWGYDPAAGTPVFSISLGDIDRPEYTIEEIFSYLESEKKPCIVAIDEFQQICEYPQKNVEALLRSHIQQMSNVTFIFAGSERHILSEMFGASSRPFYKSVSTICLEPIPEMEYEKFVCAMMEGKGRSQDNTAVAPLYNLFSGNTFYLQKTFNKAFMFVRKGSECTMREISAAVADNILENQLIFKDIMSHLAPKQKKLLIAIAEEGNASGITGEKFISRHSLSGSSSVQAAMKGLMGAHLVTREADTFYVEDMLFRLWILDNYAQGYSLPE